MNRFIGCWCLSLLACGGVSRAAAPPTAPKVRAVTLAEAAKLAMEHQGYRVERSDAGSLRVSHASRGDSLEALRVANQTLLNAEVAYWNLYRTRKILSARKQAVRSSRELLRVCEGRREAGTASKAEVAQSRNQCKALRTLCHDAASEASESERQLVALMGLEAGVRLRPSDHPSLARQRPDWDAVLREAVARRPELLISRNEVSSAGANLSAVKTFGGLLGMQPSPVLLRSLQVQLARDLEVLKDQEGKAQNFLELYYRRLSLNYKQIQSTRAQREAFAEVYQARKIQYVTGRCSLTALLAAERSRADAVAQEYASIGTYNNSLAGFEYGKGASFDRHHMVWVERR